MQTKRPVIDASGLKKAFNQRTVIDSFDLIVDEGKCIALLGPNGAGKTTTINMILGLVIPDEGRIEVFGQDISHNLRKIKQSIGVAPQTDNLDPDLTVLENLIVYASYYSIPRHTAKNRAKELLKFFALEAKQDEIIQNLSGGQRRRLILARALINRPRLIILDEPTIGLDPQARHLIWEKVEILKAEGTTILLTSHYMEEVQRLADKVIIIEQGKKILEGEPIGLIKRHVGEYVIEIPDGGQGFDGLKEDLDGCNASFEEHAKRLYIYLKGPCPQAERLGMRFEHVVKRPANLEDLFLRYTGRRLIEDHR